MEQEARRRETLRLGWDVYEDRYLECSVDAATETPAALRLGQCAGRVRSAARPSRGDDAIQSAEVSNRSLGADTVGEGGKGEMKTANTSIEAR